MASGEVADLREEIVDLRRMLGEVASAYSYTTIALFGLLIDARLLPANDVLDALDLLSEKVSRAAGDAPNHLTVEILEKLRDEIGAVLREQRDPNGGTRE